MKVLSLYIYPVKSLPGLAVDSMLLDQFGPVGDRRWMIVDEDRRFVTQRNYPKLARIGVTRNPENGQLTLEIPEQGRHPLIATDDVVRARVWADWVRAVRAEPGPDAALSAFLGQTVSLVYMPDNAERTVDTGDPLKRRLVGFADGYPFLVATQASLDDLNRRLEVAVGVRRFRPNILVDGAQAWQEDDWKTLQVGTTTLDLVKPCSRCIITTIDPDRGLAMPDLQPLRTLGQFRRQEDGVMFGMNAIHEGGGPINVGDPVTVIKGSTPEAGA